MHHQTNRCPITILWNECTVESLFADSPKSRKPPKGRHPTVLPLKKNLPPLNFRQRKNLAAQSHKNTVQTPPLKKWTACTTCTKITELAKLPRGPSLASMASKPSAGRDVSSLTVQSFILRPFDAYQDIYDPRGTADQQTIWLYTYTLYIAISARVGQTLQKPSSKFRPQDTAVLLAINLYISLS